MTARSVLDIDASAAIERIAAVVREQTLRELRRRGAVVGMSGGVDSSVAAALCVRALGAERVLGLCMPDVDSDPESLRLGRLMGARLGIETVVEDVTPILEAAGCYRRRDEAIREVVPEYEPRWRSKVVLPGVLESRGYNVFTLVVAAPDGSETRARLPLQAYLGIVAAMNMKQRTRKQLEYYHADRRHYAVVGTANRLEHDQGFFVKNGDGAADLKPLAHLYKTQVQQLAAALDVPEEIRRRPPTTDTHSLPQTQEEFYFSLPYEQVDLCLYGLDHGLPAAAIAEAVGLTAEQVERVYRDLEAKRRATRYQHARPLLVEPTRPGG
jgi:NAD+ synthase